MVPSEPPVKIYNPGQQPMIKIRDIEAERPELNSRQRKNEFEPYLNGEITNISQFTASHVEYPKRPAKKQKMSHGEDFSHLVNKAPLDNTIEYPPWYDSTAVHSREQLALPELLDGSLSSIEYMHYRNEIIQLYNKNPDYYLTLSSCKSRLDIDTVLLVRIHSFLESCNLINNKVDPRRRIFDPIIDNNPEIGIRPGSQRNFKDYLEDVGMEELRRLIYDGDLSQHRSLWDIKIEDPKNADGKQVFSCCICNTDCSEIRYQCLKVKDYQVCTDCFLEGRFSSLYFSGDFIRIESEDERTGMEEDWREDETLRLLEGVDRYEDDWLLISEHVGSKSKEQCITRFLQLPINDEFLTAKLSQSELEDLPFAETSNPVMTTVAFLSGHVNPGIGAAAAKSALRELTRSGDISSESMEEATRAALQNAVVAARKLAGYENQEIQHWTRLALKTMLDKLNMKVQQLDEVEKTIQSELNELEKQQGLVAESIEAVLHNRAQ
ncbi:SWIRM domain-containing protein [Pilobolus umbonatus]|nr:SWIRM domain-containing protein [Pilobolus umbonatus]